MHCRKRRSLVAAVYFQMRMWCIILSSMFRARREPEAPDKNGVEPAKDDWGEAGRRARQERLSRSPRRCVKVSFMSMY